MIGFNINQTSLSNFEARAKEIIESYYLTPYPKNPIKNQWQACPVKHNLRDGHIERIYHGAMHVSRVASYVDHLHSLYTKFDNHTNDNLQSLANSTFTDPQSLLTLTKYAALFHDSGRQDEDVDYWDKQSAENGIRYLRNHHVPEHLVQLMGAAAQYKGDPAKFYQTVNKINHTFGLHIALSDADYIRQLICNADVLDVMRVRTNFDLKYLDIYQKYGHNTQARNDIINMCKMAGNVISKQNDAAMDCNITEYGQYVCKGIPNANFSLSKKLAYEQADNPYQLIRQDLKQAGFNINVTPTNNVNNNLLYGFNQHKNKQRPAVAIPNNKARRMKKAQAYNGFNKHH